MISGNLCFLTSGQLAKSELFLRWQAGSLRMERNIAPLGATNCSLVTASPSTSKVYRSRLTSIGHRGLRGLVRAIYSRQAVNRSVNPVQSRLSSRGLIRASFNKHFVRHLANNSPSVGVRYTALGAY